MDLGAHRLELGDNSPEVGEGWHEVGEHCREVGEGCPVLGKDRPPLENSCLEIGDKGSGFGKHRAQVGDREPHLGERGREAKEHCLSARSREHILHHLRFEAGEAHIEFGTSLRSTPAAIVVDASQTNLRVSSPFAAAAMPVAPSLHRPPPSIAALQHMQAKSEPVQAHIANARRQLQALSQHPTALRVYARPLLRAFVQGLSLIAPEVALAAFALEGGHDLFRAAHMKALLERGPSTEEARKILHDLEPTLQQLGHREAREVLESLLAQHNPLLGGSGAK